MSSNLIIISGPTATLKSAWSIKIAQELRSRKKFCEIVNFDSLLFYKELNIGTAKPSTDEMGEVPHHMINCASIGNTLNAARYFEQASVLIHKLWDQKITPILVGGSGFYLNALMEGMFPGGTPSLEIKAYVQELFQQMGIDGIIAKLRVIDPASVERLHRNDHYRIMRALEYNLHTGQPISQAQEELNIIKESSPTGLRAISRNLHLHFDLPKPEHLLLIKQRTLRMLENGLIEEVQGLVKNGWTGEEKPLKSIGYKQVLHFLKGEIKNQEDLVNKINIATRQLAKAQRTWFNRHPPQIRLHPLNDNLILEREIYKFFATA